jgi:hypothetical protein
MENPVIKKNDAGLGNPAEIKRLNAFQRVLGVIFSPSDTMKDLVEKPRILFPLILILAAMALFILANFTMYKDYLMETTNQIFTTMGMELTAEQLQQQTSFSAIVSLIGAPIGGLLQWLITTVLIFAGVKICKGEGKFKQFMSITGYAYVVMIPYFILATVVAHITGVFDMQSSITSLSAFLSEDMKGTFIFGVLNSIDLFTIWYLAVIGIGTAFASKLKKAKVCFILIAVYVLFILFSGASQTTGNMFLG